MFLQINTETEPQVCLNSPEKMNMKLHSSAFGLICAEVNHIKQRLYKCMTLQAYTLPVIQKAQTHNDRER